MSIVEKASCRKKHLYKILIHKTIVFSFINKCQFFKCIRIKTRNFKQCWPIRWNQDQRMEVWGGKKASSIIYKDFFSLKTHTNSNTNTLNAFKKKKRTNVAFCHSQKGDSLQSHSCQIQRLSIQTDLPKV